MSDAVIAGRSVSSIRIGGKDYPTHTAPRCGVCRCAEREEIERRLVEGLSGTEIERLLAPNAEVRTRYKDEKMVAMAIGSHARKHLPSQRFLRMHQLEMAVRRQGLDPEDELANRMNATTLADMVVQIAGEKLASDELEPTLGDALAAAKLQLAIAKEMGESSVSPVESAHATVHVIGEALGELGVSDDVVIALRDKLVSDGRTAVYFAPQLPAGD